MAKKGEEREIAQVEYVGDIFVRYPGGPNFPPQKRRVRIVQSLRPRSGTIAFRFAGDCPTTVSDLPHLPLDQADLVDVAQMSRSLTTARKGGASLVIGKDVEQRYLDQGATGTRIPKQGGFSSPAELAAVGKIRKQKGSSVR